MPEGLSQSINQVIKYHITILKLKISKHDLWHNLEPSLDCLIPFPNKKGRVVPNNDTDSLKKKKHGKQAGPEAPLTTVYIVERKPLVTLLSYKLINKLKAKTVTRLDSWLNVTFSLQEKMCNFELHSSPTGEGGLTVHQ